MLARDPRCAEGKVRLFRARFFGLEHVYGTYDPASGRSWQVKQPVTDAVVLDHLRGKRPLGLYLLIQDRVRALAVDYDVDDANLPLEFVAGARRYGLDTYIEVSKSKGFHVWLFFEPCGVPAAKARAVACRIVEELRHHAEVFPKQDTIDVSSGEYGNFINLPLFAPLVMQGRTVFIDPHDGLRPAPNQWRYLEQMKTIPESLLDEIIEVNEIQVGSPQTGPTPHSLGAFQPAWTLPPCARRMFEEGVSENQRVACFRLAVLLRRVGLPFDLVLALLTHWREKNRPLNGRRIVTPDEIRAQTAYAFAKDYKGYGCEEPAVAAFCSPGCGLAPQNSVRVSNVRPTET